SRIEWCPFSYWGFSRGLMINRLAIVAFVVLLLTTSTVSAQFPETQLSIPQAKITTVSAMRARRAPKMDAEEITRLKLGTVVQTSARSTSQDTIAGKTDFWYSVTLPNGETGWLFGGLLLDYTPTEREHLVRQILEARLKAENTEYADLGEIYNLAVSAIQNAKDATTRAEFELLKVLALANWANAFPDNLRDKSPYREWLKAHATEVVHHEFAGGYTLRSEVLWQLESKYHMLPIADRIAWEASQMLPPSDCEGDVVCNFFLYDGEIKYLNLHPTGSHVSEALQHLTEGLTDEVINRANAKDGDKYAMQERLDLRKMFASLRIALNNVSSSEKAELLKKLNRVAPATR
ncbi:MAG TPA: SH3 domain-containing protein, partial [Pyrinomonadaceae bacterium]